MKHQVLYYPNFEPSQRWLRSILLFYDEIHRIVPEDAKHVDSKPMQELLQWMPDAIKITVPTQKDKEVDDFNFGRLKKALEKIASNNSRRHLAKGYHLTFGQNGETYPMKGDVWLSRSKFNEAVYNLLLQQNLATDFPYPDTDLIPANEEASDLVISYVADQMARRIGFDTITDAPIPHIVHCLDSLSIQQPSLGREGEGLLAASAAIFTIPADVGNISIDRYQPIRESFADVRTPFHEVIRSLSDLTKLTRQQSASALESRLEQAINEYQKQFNEYKKNALGRKIEKWTAFSLQSLLALLQPISSETIQVVEASGIIAVELLKCDIALKRGELKNEKTFRMLGKLNKEIEMKETVFSLI